MVIISARTSQVKEFTISKCGKAVPLGPIMTNHDASAFYDTGLCRAVATGAIVKGDPKAILIKANSLVH